MITSKLQNEEYHINDLIEVSDDDDDELLSSLTEKKDTTARKKKRVFAGPSLKKKQIYKSVFFPISIGKEFLVDLVAESKFHEKAIQRTKSLIKIFGDSLV